MAESKYVAIRPIDFPLGSGVFAFAPGDDVPASHVAEYGYADVSKDDGGPYVAKAGTKAAEHAVEQPADMAVVPHVEDKSKK